MVFLLLLLRGSQTLSLVELVQGSGLELCFFPHQLVKVILHTYLFGQTSLLGTVKALLSVMLDKYRFRQKKCIHFTYVPAFVYISIGFREL